jgi:hypothetical protein
MSLLAEFLTDAYSSLGGLAEVSSGVLEAVAGAESGLAEAVTLWVGDGPPPPALEGLHLGHPVLERALEAVRRERACGGRHLPTVPRKVGLEALVRKTLGFRNARVAFGEETTGAAPILVFHWRLTYTWDEKREDVIRVAVDTQNMRVVDAAVLERVWLEPGACSEPCAVDEAVERAQREAARLIEARVAKMESEAAKYLETERARLEEFYGGILADLDRRERRAADDRREGLREKRRSAEADRDARRRDLEEKYRVRVAARLCAVERVDVPRALVSVRLDARKAERERVASWNFLTHALDPWSCEGCDRPLQALYLCKEGHLACPRCAAECVDCRSLSCRACASSACALCEAPLCARCDGACAECGKSVCGKHRDACHPKAVAAPLSPPAPPSRPRPAATPPPSAQGVLLDAFRDLRRRWALDRHLVPIDALLAQGRRQDALDRLGALERFCAVDEIKARVRKVRSIVLSHPTTAVDRLRALHPPPEPEPPPRPTWLIPGGARTKRVEVLLADRIMHRPGLDSSLAPRIAELVEIGKVAIESSKTEEAGWAAAIGYQALTEFGYVITQKQVGAIFGVTAPTLNNRLVTLRGHMAKAGLRHAV